MDFTTLMNKAFNEAVEAKVAARLVGPHETNLFMEAQITELKRQLAAKAIGSTVVNAPDTSALVAENAELKRQIAALKLQLATKTVTVASDVSASKAAEYDNTISQLMQLVQTQQAQIDRLEADFKLVNRGPCPVCEHSATSASMFKIDLPPALMNASSASAEDLARITAANRISEENAGANAVASVLSAVGPMLPTQTFPVATAATTASAYTQNLQKFSKGYEWSIIAAMTGHTEDELIAEALRAGAPAATALDWAIEHYKTILQF